jgi:hypothetical protein
VPNPTHLTNLGRCMRTTLRTLALAAALLTLTATTAAAQPNQTQPPGDQSPDPTIVRVTAPNNGFNWDDAGIGAAAGLAISLIAVGGTLAVSRNRLRTS